MTESPLNNLIESKKCVSWLLIAFAILCKAAVAVFAKQAALASVNGGLLGIILNSWLYAEGAALILEAVTWTLVLQRVTLSFAYPFMSLAFALNLLSAWLIFGEDVRVQHIVGIALIIAGVVTIGTARKDGNNGPASELVA